MERRLLQSKNQGNWKRRKIRLGALEKEVSKRISPYEIIKKSVDYMNSLSKTKYKLIPNRIEKNTWSSEACRERLNWPRNLLHTANRNEKSFWIKKKITATGAPDAKTVFLRGSFLQYEKILLTKNLNNTLKQLCCHQKFWGWG